MKNILFDLRETLEETVSPGNDDLKIQEQTMQLIRPQLPPQQDLFYLF